MSETLKKLDKLVSAEMNIKIAKARELVRVVFGNLFEMLLKNNQICVRDFGIFYLKKIKDRICINPMLGKGVGDKHIGERFRIIFRPRGKTKRILRKMNQSLIENKNE